MENNNRRLGIENDSWILRHQSLNSMINLCKTIFRRENLASFVIVDIG